LNPARRKAATRIAVAPLLLAASLLSPSPSLGEDALITVDDAMRAGIENNLDLRVQTFNPAIAATGIHGARGIYDTRLAALLDYRGVNAQEVPDENLSTRQYTFDGNANVSQLVPSGGTLTALFNNAWYQDNLGNPQSQYVQPQLSISFSQPILQGMGREVTERGITLAQDGTDVALAEWRQNAENTAASASARFYALYKARENLDTRKASLASARRIHEENQARVKAGVLASYQLLDSELGVLAREADLLESERATRDAADSLKVFLQYPSSGTLVPTGGITPERATLTAEQATSQALQRRPEVVKARVALQSAEFLEKVSRNLALPSLSLNGAAGVAALGRGYGGALGDLASAKYPTWAVGINFSYPIGNSSAEADLASNRLKAAQARLVLKSVEESVGLEVRNALRALETRYQQVAVARKGVTVAEVRFDSYDKRLKLGLATTKDTLEAESQLVAAKEALTGALSDYQIARTELHRSIGELLDRHNLRIDDRTVSQKAWKETR
jgi:outer membrane protein TolC